MNLHKVLPQRPPDKKTLTLFILGDDVPVYVLNDVPAHNRQRPDNNTSSEEPQRGRRSRLVSHNTLLTSTV